VEMGFTPLAIAERLGHEKIETTLNTYSHLYPNKQGEFADGEQQGGRRMSGVHKYPTISFRISPREREEIEAKILASVISIHNTSIAEVSSSDNDFSEMVGLWKKLKQNYS
jgi:hypothetical protein